MLAGEGRQESTLIIKPQEPHLPCFLIFLPRSWPQGRQLRGFGQWVKVRASRAIPCLVETTFGSGHCSFSFPIHVLVYGRILVFLQLALHPANQDGRKRGFRVVDKHEKILPDHT
jgi:hypothetical protein